MRMQVTNIVTFDDLLHGLQNMREDWADGNTPLRFAHWSDPDRTDMEMVYEPAYPALIITLPRSMME